MDKNSPIDLKLFEKGTQMMRVVNNNFRKQILIMIHKKGRMSVSEIKDYLKVETKVASHHLSILRQEDLVMGDREGEHMYYTLNHTRLEKIQTLLRDMLEG